MKHDAVATTTGELTRLVIHKADGTTIDLGKPGTLGFRLRRARYIFNLKRKGLI